jgi:hypothetical protein
VRDEEFISEVQFRAGLSTRDEAERLVRAALAILGEQLPDSVAGSVAAALPEGLGKHLWGQRARSCATGAQAGRLSRGVARGEGSWPGDNTVADVDIDGGEEAYLRLEVDPEVEADSGLKADSALEVESR